MITLRNLTTAQRLAAAFGVLAVIALAVVFGPALAEAIWSWMTGVASAFVTAVAWLPCAIVTGIGHLLDMVF